MHSTACVQDHCLRRRRQLLRQVRHTTDALFVQARDATTVDDNGGIGGDTNDSASEHRHRILRTAVDVLSLHNAIEPIFMHGLRADTASSDGQQPPNSCWPFVEALNRLNPPCGSATTSTTIGCPAARIRNSRSLRWLYDVLAAGQLSAKLSILLADRQHVNNCYTEWAFMQSSLLVQTLLLCLRAVENVRPDMLPVADDADAGECGQQCADTGFARTLSIDGTTRVRHASLQRPWQRRRYQSYLDHAGDYDELRPLSCDGVNTWGSYSLTLIDALDTLAVMGNYTEFQRVTERLVAHHAAPNFDSDINVSVFETNIRIVGGLLGAHLLSHQAGIPLEPGWPCNGPLLRLAEDVASRLLPAFDTATGMPYGTVNLRHGVPPGETSVTCTAGVGTFIVEFGALTRLTGKTIYEEVALNALYALERYKSPIGLFGNHIDVQTGRWTAQDAGIGSGVDSLFEYLVKGAIMLNRPELMALFAGNKVAIDRYLKRDDWHVWVGMNKGQVTLPVFQSLEAYWPGVLSLFGDTTAAMRSLHNYHSVWRQYGFLPEFYNIPNAEAGANRENYPLRPELIESVWYLYRATADPFLLQVGEDMLRSIQHSAKTSCGYATIKNVRDHSTEDRMESFFLAETTKYLYLLFDPDNPLNNDGRHGTIIDTPNGQCLIGAGGYIFNTEAHPIDMGALRCCHDQQHNPLASYVTDRFRGDAFDWNAAASLSATSTKTDEGDGSKEEEEETTFGDRRRTMPAAAETLINAQPPPDPSEEWRRRGPVTMATIDLDARRTDAEATRRKIVAEIMSAMNERKTDADLDANTNPNHTKQTEDGSPTGGIADDSLVLEAVRRADDDADDDDSTSTGVGSAEVVNDDLITINDSDAAGKPTSDSVAVLKLSAHNLDDEDDNRSSSIRKTRANDAVDKDIDENFVAFDDSASTKKTSTFYSSNDDAANDESPTHTSTSTSASHFDQEAYIRDMADSELNGGNSSAGMIADFVHSVLRAKLPAVNTFNAEQMLERIRSLDHLEDVKKDYHMLSCRAQPFLQRLSVMGEFF